MTSPTNSNHLAPGIHERVRDDGLIEAWHRAPANLPVLPSSILPNRPCVMSLVVNHSEARAQKLFGTLRHFEWLVTDHQLFLSRHLKPGETAFNVPAEPLLHVTLRLGPSRNSPETLRGAVQTRFPSTPCSVRDAGNDVPVLMGKGVNETALLIGIDANATCRI